jgi:hypothetical protein
MWQIRLIGGLGIVIQVICWAEATPSNAAEPFHFGCNQIRTFSCGSVFDPNQPLPGLEDASGLARCTHNCDTNSFYAIPPYTPNQVWLTQQYGCVLQLPFNNRLKVAKDCFNSKADSIGKERAQRARELLKQEWDQFQILSDKWANDKGWMEWKKEVVSKMHTNFDPLLLQTFQGMDQKITSLSERAAAVSLCSLSWSAMTVSNQVNDQGIPTTIRFTREGTGVGKLYWASELKPTPPTNFIHQPGLENAGQSIELDYTTFHSDAGDFTTKAELRTEAGTVIPCGTYYPKVVSPMIQDATPSNGQIDF